VPKTPAIKKKPCDKEELKAKTKKKKGKLKIKKGKSRESRRSTRPFGVFSS